MANDKGFSTNDSAAAMRWFIVICPHCTKPTMNLSGVQFPDSAPGNEVKSLPDDISALYEEARRCVSVASYTASVLASRKLLMNIAVSHGAEQGASFASYVEFLQKHNFIPPNGKAWVDHIRRKGNEATHEIVAMTRDDAVDLITFSEMLLRFIFEFPARVPAPPESL